MTQISPNSDQRMHELSRKIGQAEKKIKEGTAEKDEAFAAAWEIYDEHNIPGFKFLANDGYYIHQQKREGSPQLNKDSLKENLITHYGERTGKRLWKQIVVVTESVDTSILEGLVRQGKIDANIVDECITVPAPTYARVRNKWTADDLNRARVLGIEIEE